MRDITPISDQNNGTSNEYESLLGILPIQLEQAFRLVPKTLLEQDEVTLTTLCNPTEQMRMIRTRLWEKFPQYREKQTRLTIDTWTNGICYPEYLVNRANDNRFLAWVMTPLADYDNRITVLLEKGYQKMKEILDTPIIDPATGKIDLKSAAMVLSVVKMLDMRKHGGYVQKIEEKSMQFHASAKDAKEIFGSEGLSLEQIEARIRELEGSQQTVERVIYQKTDGR